MGKVVIELELGESTEAAIRRWLKSYGQAEGSHGPIGLAALARMLLEDVAEASERPGSWNGSAMLELLAKHGYGEG